MKYILTVTLALLVSLNGFADDIYEKEAKELSSNATAAKIFLANGKYGYHLWSHQNTWIEGALEAKASELCGKKGYSKVLDETLAPWRRYIIQCSE
tara:strand:+ start:488 stop:775 length:288 start_codon:yes stop_codon:yes gene_type:complete